MATPSPRSHPVVCMALDALDETGACVAPVKLGDRLALALDALPADELLVALVGLAELAHFLTHERAAQASADAILSAAARQHERVAAVVASRQPDEAALAAQRAGRYRAFLGLSASAPAAAPAEGGVRGGLGARLAFADTDPADR